MKLLTNFNEKVGSDKVLHFLIGALLDAMLLPLGVEYTLLGIGLVWLLSCVKELIDSFEKGNKCDWYDAISGTAGAACMCIYFNLTM